MLNQPASQNMLKFILDNITLAQENQVIELLFKVSTKFLKLFETDLGCLDETCL